MTDQQFREISHLFEWKEQIEKDIETFEKENAFFDRPVNVGSVPIKGDAAASVRAIVRAHLQTERGRVLAEIEKIKILI